LHEIDVGDLEALERFVDLAGGDGFAAAVDFCHEEGFVTVAIEQGLTHADFALAAVIVPGVIEKVDAAIEGGADDLDALGFEELGADVIAAEPDAGDALAGGTESAVGDAAVRGVGSACGGAEAGGERGGGGRFEEGAAGEGEGGLGGINRSE
jgi:hypothetical protein